MNTKDWYSHLVPLDELICRFSPHPHHTTQTIVIKLGKNNRLCWDETTAQKPSDIVMNHIMPTTHEAPITFGQCILHLKHLLTNGYSIHHGWHKGIFLICQNTCRPNRHFWLPGRQQLHLATAMDFGSTASASSWEPFCQAIIALLVVNADRPDLVMKHKEYLDTISRADLDLYPNIIPAASWLINKSIFDANGQPAHLLATIYSDDALLLA